MKGNLLNKVWLRVMMIVAVMTTTFAGTAQAADVVYKTALFGRSNCSGLITNYTSTWNATNDNFTVSLVNFANGEREWLVVQNFWGYIACGSNSPATITTAATIEKPITKVAVTIDAISNASRVNSIKLYSSADYATWTEVGTFSKSTGTQTVSISSPAANHFYRIVVDCASGTQNNVHISKVEYYKADESNTVATPVISGTQKFDPSTQVTITCATTGASIQYSLDGGTTWIDYSNAFTIYATTTVKAKATKDGMTDSPEVSKSFSHADDVVDCTWNLKAAPTGGEPSASLATWTNDAEGNPTGAVMSMAKGGSSNNVTAHLGNSSDGTYFYNNQILMITPIDGYTIVSVEITVSGSTDGLTGNAWSNATASANGTKVALTPNDGTAPISVVCAAGNNSLFGAVIEEYYTTITGVKVEYSPTTSPYIAVTNDVVNATSAVTSGFIEVAYNKVNEDGAEVLVVDENNEEVTWITAELDEDNNLSYTIAANTTFESRTAYMAVHVEGVYSPVITVTQEAPVIVSISYVGYGTLYYQHLNLVVPDGIEAYTYTYIPGNNRLTRNTIYRAGDVIPKNSPVALKSETVPARGETIKYAFIESSEADDRDEANLLLGSENGGLTTGDGSYFYALAIKRGSNDPSTIGFYWMEENGAAFNIGAHKAYLALPVQFSELVSGTNGAKNYVSLTDVDDPTGIDEFKFEENSNDAIYNLSGQRINKMQKGINIVNGKKVLK